MFSLQTYLDNMDRFRVSEEKVAFVINPVSGGLDKKELTGTFAEALNVAPESLKILETTGDNDESLIRNFVEENNPEAVFAVGGDGTVNLVSKVLMNSSVLMGIIPLGSANGLATDLEIPDDPVEALMLMETGATRKIDLIRIDEEHISVHISDIGLNAKIVKRYNEEKSRGMPGYARQFFREIRSAKPGKFAFEINGKQFRKKAHMVVVANASRYGTGARINPSGRIDDGRFEVCIFKRYPWWAIFKMLAYFVLGKLHELEYVDVFHCERARIENRSRYVFQVDGEPMGDREQIEPEIIPAALEVFVPSRS